MTLLQQDQTLTYGELADLRARNKVRIVSLYQKKDVRFRQKFIAHSEFKYTCPVCLLYFNSILVSSCCGNYICRFCIGALARKAKRDPEFVITCSHCKVEDFKLNDVDLEAPIKYYTDTPMKTTQTSEIDL